MHLRSICLFILLLAFSLSAQTEVGGSASGLWTLFGSPYQLTADVLVASGDTLVIESNVEVDLGSQYTLRIEGLLVAFEASMSNGGELFGAGGYLVLTGCDFQGLTSGLKIYGGQAEIEGCLINNTAGTGVTFNAVDSSFLFNSRITNSGDYGVKIRATDDVEIVGNIFSGNSTNDTSHPALFLDSASPLTIEHNLIQDNHAQGLGVWSTSSTAMPSIRFNIIRRNFTGITLVNSPAFIENNTIVANFVEGNSNSGAGIYAGYSSSIPIV
ncbi:MAG: right-handed parallel beta-helix repeat-containing protein, partial [Candidatus Marinimicrobia bacterium]|nr:right-handed parallel beta-helix repeat-containing protein [Candidatus Neomarinimicrobiota bacterium]